MLSVMNGVALTHFASGQQIRIPAARDRARFKADHRADAQAPLTHWARGHAHEPVDAAELVTRPMRLTGLIEELHERVAVQHHVPVAHLRVEPEHRREVWQPGGS